MGRGDPGQGRTPGRVGVLDETRAGLRGPGVGAVALVAPKSSLLFVASFTMTSEKGSIVAAVSELCSRTATAGDTKYRKGRRRELNARKVGEKVGRRRVLMKTCELVRTVQTVL